MYFPIDSKNFMYYNVFCKGNTTKSTRKNLQDKTSHKQKYILYNLLHLYSTSFADFCQVSLTKYIKNTKQNYKEVVNIYKVFIAEVKKQLCIKGWKYADLAKATGYTVGTIEAFMCGARTSKRMADCIAKVLDIGLE